METQTVLKIGKYKAPQVGIQTHDSIVSSDTNASALNLSATNEVYVDYCRHSKYWSNTYNDCYFLYGFVNFQSNQNKLTMLKLAKTVIDFPVMAFRV